MEINYVEASLFRGWRFIGPSDGCSPHFTTPPPGHWSTHYLPQSTIVHIHSACAPTHIKPPLSPHSTLLPHQPSHTQLLMSGSHAVYVSTYNTVSSYIYTLCSLTMVWTRRMKALNDALAGRASNSRDGASPDSEVDFHPRHWSEHSIDLIILPRLLTWPKNVDYNC